MSSIFASESVMAIFNTDDRLQKNMTSHESVSYIQKYSYTIVT